MKIKEKFPLLFESTQHQNSPIWGETFNYSENAADLCCALFDFEISDNQTSIDLAQKKALLILTEVSSLKGQTQAEQEILFFDYLKFYVCTGMLRFLTGKKILPYCFNWLCHSASEEIAAEGKCNFCLDFISIFLTTDQKYIKKRFLDLLPTWVRCLFYYSNHTGGHKEMAKWFMEEYLEHYLKLCAYHKDPEKLYSLLFIAPWLYKFHFNQVLEKVSDILSENVTTCSDRKIKRAIFLHFAIADKPMGGRTRNEWYQALIPAFGDELTAIENLQLVSSRYSRDLELLSAHLPELTKVVKKVAKERKEQGDLGEYHTSRIFSVLERTLVNLIKSGQTKQATALIGAYFGISAEEVIRLNILYIISNVEDSVIFSSTGHTIFAQICNQGSIKELVATQNDFLRTNHQLHDVLDFELEERRRFGEPDEHAATIHHQALRSHFTVQRIFELPDLEALGGIHILDNAQWPLQALICKETGIALPIVHSFREPYPQREIKSVYFWEGDNQLARYEADAMKHYFTSVGIEVTHHRFEENTKQDFLHNYHSSAYDLIYVISHGEFRHFEAHKSFLSLGPDIKISADELIYKDDTGMRRLLLLAGCDTATVNMGNHPDALGIGPKLVNPNQSLFGHEWPIRDISGLIYGSLISSLLAKNLPYQHVYKEAMHLYLSGHEALVKYLGDTGIPQESLNRIENQVIVHENFFYWASLTYFI